MDSGAKWGFPELRGDFSQEGEEPWVVWCRPELVEGQCWGAVLRYGGREKNEGEARFPVWPRPAG